jgi:hypothetical protein
MWPTSGHRYVRAKTSQAILVALIPQLEEKDPFGYQVCVCEGGSKADAAAGRRMELDS